MTSIPRLLVLASLCIAPGLNATGEDLRPDSDIDITVDWSQQPDGWRYPMAIHVPEGEPPVSGLPVCILLHGNGGSGAGMLPGFIGLLPCHALVAPSGYASSWNICGEGSDAPDLEMIADLVDRLQTFDNVDPNRIRILGVSNGSALANRILLENDDPGIDRIAAVVSQLVTAQRHGDAFFRPGGTTERSAAFCGYDVEVEPVQGRRYLGICNENDSVIRYDGGPGPGGLVFLEARDSAFQIARSQGYPGEPIAGSGERIGRSNVFAYEYLDGRVVHLRGDAGHGMNAVQREFVRDFFDGCAVPPPCPADFNGDGRVNGADLGLLAAAWQTAVGDLDGDGTTGGSDVGLLLAAWGECPGDQP